MHNEKYIKTLLIDHIKKSSDIEVIASEVPYFGGKRRVDILVLKTNESIAYEIKSPLDDLTKLRNQVEDYNNSFHCTYVVFSEKHALKNFYALPRSVGLIKVSDEQLTIVRLAQKRKKVCKKNISYFFWRENIISILNEYKISFDKNLETTELRKKMLNSIEAESLITRAYNCLRLRYVAKYQNFLNFVGDKTTLSDLDELTLPLRF